MKDNGFDIRLYLNAIIHKIITFLIACAAFYYVDEICAGGIYPALAKAFPSVFPTYNQVLEKEAYQSLMEVVALYSGMLTVFIVEYFAGAVANERFEYMIRKTDGMYLIKEGVRLYYPRYLLPDLASVFLTVSLFQGATLLVPAELRDNIIFSFFRLSSVYATRLGLILGILAQGAVYFTATLLSGLRAINKWRGKWLSASSL